LRDSPYSAEVATDDLNPPNPQSSAGGSPSSWFGRRKRIVSREVHSEPAHSKPPSESVTSEMHSAAGRALGPADLIQPPAPRPADALVVDPTAFSVRQRKRSENRTYRLAQGALALSFLSGAGSIVTFFIGDHTLALWLAIGACALAILGVIIVRSSRLAYRLRGYAAATGVFAVSALVLTFFPSPAHEDETPTGNQIVNHDPHRPTTATHPASTRSAP
jgi:hypothetical protein